MNRHDRYLDILEKVAESMEPMNRFRLAAMIVYRNKIISIGQCGRKSHPMQKKYGSNTESICKHAEIDSIVKALGKISTFELSKSTLYVLRLKKVSTKDHSLVRAMAKPCSGCQRAIDNFDIKRIFYTIDNESYEERNSN